MGVELRAALVFALALTGCGETFDSVAPAGGSGGTGGITDSGGSGGGGATAATSGSGGDPCDASDNDGDSYSVCDGDCDDSAPDIHPGAIEICGDNIDQNCDGVSEEEPPCDGNGTFVHSVKGKPGAKGTRDFPVATISEGVEKALQIGVPTAVLVSAGNYTEDIVVTGKISVIGGYDPDDWSQRDPDVHKTVVKSTKAEGLKLIGTEQPMILSGLAVHGRTVTAGNEPSIALTIDGGEPIVSGNIIEAGNVSVGAGSSVGVRVATESAGGGVVHLENNTIAGGTSVGGGSYGVLVVSPTMFTYISKGSVSASKGVESIALMLESAAGADARHAVFQSGTATGDVTVPSTSLGVWALSGTLLFDSNLVNPDQVFAPPKCLTPDVWCGGARISVAEAVLTNNILYGSLSGASAALHLQEIGPSLEGVVISSNLLSAAGTSDALTRSASVVLGSPPVDGGTTLLGRFRNNILLGGISEKTYGFFEQPTPGDTVDPKALDHNLFYFPVVGGTPGVLYQNWNGISHSAITMIANLPGDGANLFENPLFSNSHIEEGSPCRNSGTSIDAPSTDRDGDARPQEGEFDIGPDELMPAN